MISMVLTILLIEVISLLANTPCKKEIKVDEFRTVLLMNAKHKYIDAYKLTDNCPNNLSALFDYLVNTTKIVGVVNLNNSSKFKSTICDSIIASQYPSASYKAEAMFVFDFVMEAYREICTANLNYEYDLSLILRN